LPIARITSFSATTTSKLFSATDQDYQYYLDKMKNSIPQSEWELMRESLQQGQ